jgi:FkbM family methyltransferase
MELIDKTSLTNRLDQLLDESIESIISREKTAFDSLTQNTRDVLIFGAGNVGKRALFGLKRNGYNVLGFIDNNQKLHGKQIKGTGVFSPDDAFQKFGGDVVIVIGIHCGEASGLMSQRIAPLKLLGFKKIAHYGLFAWKYPEGLLPYYSLDLPSKVQTEREKVYKAFDLLDDDRSRKIYVDHIEWRLTLNFDVLPTPVEETIYFNEKLLKSNPDEVLVDGGAYTGDTIKSFVEGFGKEGFSKALCFEPDPDNFAKLREFTECLGKKGGAVQAFPFALGNKEDDIYIELSGISSRVSVNGILVKCKKIDNIDFQGSFPTFIKLDLEGFEIPALQGAAQIIAEKMPTLVICSYHKQNDIWEIPLSINALNPNYKFRYAQHLSDGWDLVLYAADCKRFI